MAKAVMWIVGAAVALFILGLILDAMQSPEARAKQQARDRSKAAIKLCWQDHDRKSLTPGEQRFIAGTCERMEADLRAK